MACNMLPNHRTDDESHAADCACNGFVGQPLVLQRPEGKRQGGADQNIWSGQPFRLGFHQLGHTAERVVGPHEHQARIDEEDHDRQDPERQTLSHG